MRMPRRPDDFKGGGPGPPNHAYRRWVEAVHVDRTCNSVVLVGVSIVKPVVWNKQHRRDLIHTSLSEKNGRRAHYLGRRLPLLMAPRPRARVVAPPACRSVKEKRVERKEARATLTPRTDGNLGKAPTFGCYPTAENPGLGKQVSI